MVSKRKRYAVIWRRAGLGLRAFVFALAALLFAFLVYIQRPEEELGRTGGSILVITLINFIVVVICVLAFLIGRNVVKLIFDRRRGILGSQLRARLVFALVGLTLIPTAILFFLASGLLSRAMEGWFSTTVENAVGGAVEVARRHHEFLREYQADVFGYLKSELRQQKAQLAAADQLRLFLEGERKRWKLFSIRIVAGDGAVVAEAQNAVAQLESFREPDLDKEAVGKAMGGEVQVRFEERESSQFMRAYGPLTDAVPSVLASREPLAMVSTLRVSPELTQTLTTVNESFREYEQLKLFRGGVRSNYLLTLAMITGLLLFSAVWIAFYIARELAVPIQRIADATHLVAKGRDDVQIREVGDDEMGQLVRAFNRMTSDLRRSRQERERHRAYLEAILRNLAVGVIAIDPERRITSINTAAAETFGIDEPSLVLGKELREVFVAEEYEAVAGLVEQLRQEVAAMGGAERALERELIIRNRGRELKIVCTAGRILAEGDSLRGYALLFDDITELSKAQHVAAWREVAQRIAHEIKNPLTPIQLSAQRLEKLVREEQTVDKEELRGKITESAQTIVEHVDSIKRLANEFSQFARMPHAEFASQDLNEIVSSVVEPFGTSHQEIVFQVIADRAIPRVYLDREQIRRVLINLIDNAIGALRDMGHQRDLAQAAPKITIKTSFDTRSRMVSFEVADTGPGISAQDKLKIFEPYITTKKGGTGLGLAIVTTIVAEHQGRVRVFDNSPHGARFVVDLPLHPQRSTQRRFAA